MPSPAFPVYLLRCCRGPVWRTESDAGLPQDPLGLLRRGPLPVQQSHRLLCNSGQTSQESQPAGQEMAGKTGDCDTHNAGQTYKYSNQIAGIDSEKGLATR